MNGHTDPQEYVLDVVNDVDKAKGVYDTTKYITPNGQTFVNRKPLTPEQLDEFRPKK